MKNSAQNEHVTKAADALQLIAKTPLYQGRWIADHAWVSLIKTHYSNSSTMMMMTRFILTIFPLGQYKISIRARDWQRMALASFTAFGVSFAGAVLNNTFFDWKRKES